VSDERRELKTLKTKKESGAGRDDLQSCIKHLTTDLNAAKSELTKVVTERESELAKVVTERDAFRNRDCLPQKGQTCR